MPEGKARFAVLLCLAGFFCSGSQAAVITGVVTAPGGGTPRPVFVEAQDTNTHRTVAVLADDTDHYRIGNLPAGTFKVFARAAGYGVDTDRTVTVASDARQGLDLVLSQRAVRWGDLSIHQARELFPEGKGSDLLFEHCTACHGFQSEMANASNDAEGWKMRVEHEQSRYGGELAHLTAQDVQDISYYLARLFGPQSVLEKSPAERTGEDRHAGYLDTVPRYGPDSEGIVYVEYDAPPPDFPLPRTVTADLDSIEKARNADDLQLDDHGNAWLTDPKANELARIDRKTLRVSQWELPTPNAGPRRVQVASNGVIWLTEFRANKLASFDPATKRFKEYVLPGSDPSPWALAFDAAGDLWYSSYNMDEVARFDTGTGKVTRYPCPHVEFSAREFRRDSAGRIWYASAANHKVGYFYLQTRQ
ncbi:MAG TPA: carboxypeptidase regulatory-like domain-containing protein [Steroidobacteraceae bacterium]